MSPFESNLLIVIIVLGAAMVGTAMFSIISPRLGTDSLAQIFAGYKTPPILVAFMRRGLTVLLTGLVTWVARALNIVEDPENLAALAGAVATFIEVAIWGLFDQLRKSGQNDRDPKPVAGSGGDSPASIP